MSMVLLWWVIGMFITYCMTVAIVAYEGDDPLSVWGAIMILSAIWPISVPTYIFQKLGEFIRDMK